MSYQYELPILQPHINQYGVCLWFQDWQDPFFPYWF